MGKAITSAQQAATADRRRQAIEMRIAGHSWQAIADALGYDSKGSANTDVRRALEQARVELAIPREALRELEAERLDAELVRLEETQAAIWLLVQAGDLRAIDTSLRIEEARRRNAERRSKLLGLDAPAQVELTMEAIDAALADTAAELAAARRDAAETDSAPDSAS